MKDTKLLPLTEQLKRAIAESGQTQADISRGTGIGRDVLSRFMRGERGVSNAVMDRLGLYLGLRIVGERKAKRGD